MRSLITRRTDKHFVEKIMEISCVEYRITKFKYM